MLQGSLSALTPPLSTHWYTLIWRFIARTHRHAEKTRQAISQAVMFRAALSLDGHPAEYGTGRSNIITAKAVQGHHRRRSL
jgi:hypothetical protein